MGFATAARERSWKQMRDYQSKLLAMAHLAGEAAFHLKHGRDREANLAVKKLGLKSKELQYGNSQAVEG